ncbi:hypothetical protein EUX98_g3325 [Antrodiella citrinella]|uniref:RNA exonuclease 4 n=1 Tax=Antrodiella citrinella TaxID=2447956 RepID=A0A4S4MZD0_9APHY|nr:hypothetical protein EUX98_g3325 [Antrodiella citrinella]
MGKKDETKASKPSTNWLALQKSLPTSLHVRKKRKFEHTSASPVHETVVDDETDFVRGHQPFEPVASTSAAASFDGSSSKNGESLAELRKMIAGELQYSESQTAPGKYLALDCEMVGVGPEGAESSLARVSMVNYYGAIQLDEFVRQRERVVDYRTQWSGIRPSDMIKAKPFEEVQKKVAELIKDRILVGHAIHNDLKVLLLSQPRSLVRDTQIYAGKHKVTKSRRPALRMLVQQELGVAIQEGEHSSVTDARATMAVYRLHRKDWDKGVRPPRTSASKKRKATEDDSDGDDDDAQGRNPAKRKKSKKQEKAFPGGGRKGVSSGLSTVIKQGDGRDNPGGGSGQRVEKKTAPGPMGDGNGNALLDMLALLKLLGFNLDSIGVLAGRSDATDAIDPERERIALGGGLVITAGQGTALDAAPEEVEPELELTTGFLNADVRCGVEGNLADDDDKGGAELPLIAIALAEIALEPAPGKAESQAEKGAEWTQDGR